MKQEYNNPDHAERNHQIKKLLQAIANYNPSNQELQSMQNAKRQMIKNIEKKFNQSQLNANYKFPFVYEIESDDEQFYDFTDADKVYVLADQNKLTRRSIGRQKSRLPLRQKLQNKLSLHMHEQKQQIQSLKQKQVSESFVNSIHKVIKTNLKCQTPKVIKKQIILTNKKHTVQKQNTKTVAKQQHSNMFTFCQPSQSTGVRAKLKIKKPNSTLNETKKQIHLRTENNVTFKHYHDNSVPRRENQYDQCQQLPKPIYQQPSLEDSLFNNSRLNQNMDENPDFQYPSRGMFNVHELKQKLRDTSKSCKKIGIKRHKRTATQGDTSMIKIKLFSNSYRKEDFRQVDDQQKHNVSTHLFMKKPQNVSTHTVIQRTVRSTMSQNSLKKGISVCGKTRQNDDKSQQKSNSKFIERSLSKQCRFQKRGENKQAKVFQKTQIKNFTIMLKPSENKKKQFMESKSVRKDLSTQKVTNLNSKKQNYETARISKINSIMSNLKEQYKNKNHMKSRTGIKTTICA